MSKSLRGHSEGRIVYILPLLVTLWTSKWSPPNLLRAKSTEGGGGGGTWWGLKFYEDEKIAPGSILHSAVKEWPEHKFCLPLKENRGWLLSRFIPFKPVVPVNSLMPEWGLLLTEEEEDQRVSMCDQALTEQGALSNEMYTAAKRYKMMCGQGKQACCSYSVDHINLETMLLQIRSIV